MNQFTPKYSPVAQWYDYLARPTLADAFLDRLLAKAHRIELQGESLRKQAGGVLLST